MKLLRYLLCIVAILSCSACGQMLYETTRKGAFDGSLDVRWIKPDRFVYIPNEMDPLRFTTPEGRIIRPQRMYTDGGSIPRLFWGIQGFSPWGYAPAYIVHDWIFLAHHCKFPEYGDVSFERSATLMAEGIKTLMDSGVAPKDWAVMYAIYEAVRSPIAKQIWDSPAPCDLPSARTLGQDLQGELIMRIDVKGVQR